MLKNLMEDLFNVVKMWVVATYVLFLVSLFFAPFFVAYYVVKTFIL